MTRIRHCFFHLSWLIALLFLSGCSGIKSDSPRQNLFRISADSREISQLEQGAGLLVRPFDINPEFESGSFVFRVSQDQFKEDFYNKFMISPARMITNAVREDLIASPVFKSVPAREPIEIPYRLRGKVLDLYADIQDTQTPKAVMTLRLILEKENSKGFATVISQTYPVQVPVDSLDASDFARAWNQCLSMILSDFYKDVKDSETVK